MLHNIIAIVLQNVALNACKEKFDWMESTPEATTQDFIVQKQILEEALAPVNQKLSEPRKS